MLLLQCMSPLLAQSGRGIAAAQCPLLGVKRTRSPSVVTAAFDPKRTWRASQSQDVLGSPTTPISIAPNRGLTASRIALAIIPVTAGLGTHLKTTFTTISSALKWAVTTSLGSRGVGVWRQQGTRFAYIQSYMRLLAAVGGKD